MQELAPRADDLAKGWLLALVEQADLGRAPAILASDLPREGPRLCAGIVRALASDAALAELAPGGELHELAGACGQLAGAADPAEALRAVDGLAAVIWSGVRGAVEEPDADDVAVLAERLARVMETVRAAVLAQATTVRAAVLGQEAPVGAPGTVSSPPEPQALRFESAPGGGRAPAGEGPEEQGPGALATEAPGSESLWRRALGEDIVRAEQSGGPLSLLLIELEDADRVRAAEPGSGGQAAIGRFVQAVRSVVRRQDMLARETDTRVWVIARDTGRWGAQALGERAVRAVQTAGGWRGASLAISVGFAVLGEDASEVDALVAAAEQARYAASASGSGVAGVAATAGAADERR